MKKSIRVFEKPPRIPTTAKTIPEKVVKVSPIKTLEGNLKVKLSLHVVFKKSK